MHRRKPPTVPYSAPPITSKNSPGMRKLTTCITWSSRNKSAPHAPLPRTQAINWARPCSVASCAMRGRKSTPMRNITPKNSRKNTNFTLPAPEEPSSCAGACPAACVRGSCSFPGLSWRGTSGFMAFSFSGGKGPPVSRFKTCSVRSRPPGRAGRACPKVPAQPARKGRARPFRTSKIPPC